MLHRALYLHIVLAHEHAVFLVFSHPDCTVGPGTSPDHASLERVARGLYRRSGIGNATHVPSLTLPRRHITIQLC
jgi:hypothetical protein